MRRVPLSGELARVAQTHGGGIHAQPWAAHGDLGSELSQGGCCASANSGVGRCCLSFIFLGVSLDAARVSKKAGVERERRKRGDKKKTGQAGLPGPS